MVFGPSQYERPSRGSSGQFSCMVEPRPAGGQGRSRMRLGISLTSSHVVKDPREGARWMIERAAAAHRAGLDSLFVGDHHSTPDALLPERSHAGAPARRVGRPARRLPLPAAACGTPCWSPSRWARWPSIARGRFIFQCGLGTAQPQFAAMGAEIKQRPSAFEEAFGIIQRLLRGETVSGGRRFAFENATVALRPAENVEYWIGAPGAARHRPGGAPRRRLSGVALPDARRRARADRLLPRAMRRLRPSARRPSRSAATSTWARAQPRPEATADAVLARGYRGFSREALVIGDVDEVVGPAPAAGGHGLHRRHRPPPHRRPAQGLGSMARLAEVRRALAS